MSFRRRRILTLAGLLLAVGWVALVAAQGSDGAPDRASEWVPRDAQAYLHLSTNVRRDVWGRAGEAIRELPSGEALRDDLLARVSARFPGVDLARDVAPWLGDEAALAELPARPPATPAGRGPRARAAATGASSLLILDVGDEAAARRFLDRVAGAPDPARHRAAEIRTSRPMAGSLHEGFVLVGPPAAVRAALDVRAGAAPSLARERPYREQRDAFEGDRLGFAYVTGPGAAVLPPAVRDALIRLGGGETLRLGAFTLALDDERARLGFRALTGPAPAARVEPAGPGRPPEPPGARCPGAEPAEPSALEHAPAGTVAYLHLRGLDCLLRDLTASRSSVGRLLRRVEAEAARDDAVDFRREVLPLFAGESALVVSTSGLAPAAALVVDGVDERRALEVLGRLQPALVRLAQPTELGTAPTFDAREVEGVTALTAALAPGLELSYAAFDRRLVISTSLAGIAAARKDGELEDADSFELLLGERPERLSALVFLDLDRLLTLGQLVGLAEDPRLLALSDDLQRLGAVGANLSRKENAVTGELATKIP